MYETSKWTRRAGVAILVSFAVIFVNAFTSSSALAATAPSLGTAENFAVLGGQTVTNTGPSVITGDLGVSPGSAVTGFPPGTVTGTIHETDGVAQQAQLDALTAYNDLAAELCDTDLTGQDLGGMTLIPGVYCFDTSAQLTGTLILDAQGDPNSVFIFRTGSTLTTASNSAVEAINSSSDLCNIYWQIGSSATLGTATALQGNILAHESITLNNGASLAGRALALNGAVTLDTNNVAIVVCARTPTPTPTVSPTPTPTASPTPTPTMSPSPTPTLTPEGFKTPIPSPTPTMTPRVPTPMPSPTPVIVSLNLIKTICWVGDSAVSVLPPGAPAHFQYIVTNTGLVPLEDIVVTDDAGTPEDPSDDFIVGIIPGPVPVEATFTLQTLQTIGAQMYNTAWARSTGAGVPVSDSDTALGYTWRGVADADYNGDGTTDPAFFAFNDNSWRINLAPIAPPEVVFFGNWGDIMVPGDYDGDGTTDIAIFRDYTGLWAIRGLTRAYFGTFRDLPVPADYDGDGTIDIAVCRRQTGLWAVRDLTRLYFGSIFDLPVPGDYDGSGTDRPAIYRPETGMWAVFGAGRTYFGGMEDHPVPADYNGDGISDLAIFRGRTGLWAVSGLTRTYFGQRFDWPQPGYYHGDGTADMAIFRPASGLWAVRDYTRSYWGLPNSVPVTW